MNNLTVTVTGHVVKDNEQENILGTNYTELNVEVAGGGLPEFYIGHEFSIQVIMGEQDGHTVIESTFIDSPYSRGYAAATWNLLSMLSDTDWFAQLKEIALNAYLNDDSDFEYHYKI